MRKDEASCPPRRAVVASVNEPLIEGVDRNVLKQRREQMRQEKQEWQQTTQRLAREVLK
jgi:hypothetical protein